MPLCGLLFSLHSRVWLQPTVFIPIRARSRTRDDIISPKIWGVTTAKMKETLRLLTLQTYVID